jgi:hypothetical protein
MYYVPSIQKEIIFKELTIGQFLNIYKNFNIQFCKTLIDNCTESVNLTNFDKEIIFLQIHLNEIKEVNIPQKNIVHPDKQNIKDGLYSLDIVSPFLNEEILFNQFIKDTSIVDKNILLLLEITKYISTLCVNNTNINLNISIKDKIKITKELPPLILAKCIQCIDNIKRQTKQYFAQNNTSYKYNISLLVP